MMSIKLTLVSAIFVLYHSNGIGSCVFAQNSEHIDSPLKLAHTSVLFHQDIFLKHLSKVNYSVNFSKDSVKPTLRYRRSFDALDVNKETWTRVDLTDNESTLWAQQTAEGSESKTSATNASSKERAFIKSSHQNRNLAPMSLTQVDNSTAVCKSGECTDPADMVGEYTSLNAKAVSFVQELLNNSTFNFLEILINGSEFRISDNLTMNLKNLNDINNIFIDETEMTMLHAAVKSENADVVRALLDIGFDPNAQDMYGFTALHASVAKGNLDIFNIVLSSSAVDVDKQTSSGSTALHLASILKETDMAEQLLKHGANPYVLDFEGSNALHLAAASGPEIVSLILEANSSMIDETDKFHRSPLYLSATKGVSETVQILLNYNATPDIPDMLDRTALMVVVARNNEKMCELLLNGGSDPYYSKNIYKMTPFHLAVSRGLTPIVEKMLNFSNEGIDLLNIEGKTPLCLAVSMNNIPLVKLLLNHGADPFVGLINRNWTVLHIAADQGYVDVAKLVLEKDARGIDIRNHLGQTALYRGLLRNRTEMFDLFMKYGADCSIPSHVCTTPLMIASGECFLHVVEEILDRKQEQVNKKNAAGETALLLAASHNCTDTFEYLLSKGASCHTSSDEGWTPLHSAAKGNNLKMVELILKSNISTVNVRDKLGQTPLFVSSIRSRIAVFRRLLYITSDPYVQTADGLTVLHRLVRSKKIEHAKELLMYNSSGINVRQNEGMTALFSAAVMHDFPMFALLLKSGADPYIADNNQTTPLHVAVVSNETEMVKYLLSINSSGVNFQNEGGLTALHLSTEYPPICEELLKHGANQSIRGYNGKTPLHLAASIGVTRSVILLLENDDSVVDARDKTGGTALHWAADGNHTDICIALLDKSANTDLINLAGVIPLQLASDKSNILLVEMLLNRSDSLINYQTYEGFTPLHFATHKDHVGIVRLLLASGADPDIPDYKGYTCCHFAARYGLYRMMEIFVSMNPLSLNVQNIEGVTPLVMAAYQGEEEVFRLILSNGGTLNPIDTLGRTLLHAAVIGGSENIVKVAVNLTENYINTTDVFGMSPLLIVCPNVSLFHMLYDKGANPLIRWRGFTTLHFAAHYGHIEVLERILEDYPESINILNPAGISPLHIAYFSKQRQVVEFLIDRGANILSINHLKENILHYSHPALDTDILVDIFLKGVIKKLNPMELELFINQANAHGLTPIAKATIYGNSYFFQVLLDLGCVLNTRTVQGDSILHLAANGGNFPILDFLLQHTAIPIDIKNFEGVTPVMKAALGGKELGFEMLELRNADLTTVSKFNETLLHFAAIGSSNAIVEKLLLTGMYVIDAKDAEGFTPMMHACIHENYHIVKLLLQHGADPLMKNIYGETSIELAARQGNFDVLKLFSSSDYDADALLGTVLTRSIQFNNDTEVILHLLDRSTIAQNPIFLFAAKGDDSELMLAFLENDIPRAIKIPKILKTFMKEYDSLLDELITRENHTVPTNFEKYVTPLDVALMFFGKPSTVRVLVDRMKINISKIEEEKAMWSPLDYSIYSMERFSHHLDDKNNVLNYLLGVVNITDNKKHFYGWTTVHKAAWFGNLIVVQLMKRKGAYLHSKDIYGRTPLHIAALKGYVQIIEVLVADSKRYVDSRDMYGFTPLHLVQVYGKRRFFSRFSQAKSDMGSEARSYFVEKVDILDAHLEARTRNFQDAMLVLLENGADIDAQDLTYGWTPLHWAAVNGDMRKAVTLVMKGASLNIPSKNDETPMFLARKWGRRAVYHFLKSKGAVW